MVQHHRSELYQLLSPEVLPLFGDLYRAVWPLAAAFILCVTCVDEEERLKLQYGLIHELHQSESYSVRAPCLYAYFLVFFSLFRADYRQNIPSMLGAVSKVWNSKELDMNKRVWWEDMVNVIGSERISFIWIVSSDCFRLVILFWDGLSDQISMNFRSWLKNNTMYLKLIFSI